MGGEIEGGWGQECSGKKSGGVIVTASHAFPALSPNITTFFFSSMNPHQANQCLVPNVYVLAMNKVCLSSPFQSLPYIHGYLRKYQKYVSKVELQNRKRKL